MFVLLRRVYASSRARRALSENRLAGLRMAFAFASFSIGFGARTFGADAWTLDVALAVTVVLLFAGAKATRRG